MESDLETCKSSRTVHLMNLREQESNLWIVILVVTGINILSLVSICHCAMSYDAGTWTKCMHGIVSMNALQSVYMHCSVSMDTLQSVTNYIHCMVSMNALVSMLASFSK